MDSQSAPSTKRLTSSTENAGTELVNKTKPSCSRDGSSNELERGEDAGGRGSSGAMTAATAAAPQPAPSKGMYPMNRVRHASQQQQQQTQRGAANAGSSGADNGGGGGRTAANPPEIPPSAPTTATKTKLGPGSPTGGLPHHHHYHQQHQPFPTGSMGYHPQVPHHQHQQQRHGAYQNYPSSASYNQQRQQHHQQQGYADPQAQAQAAASYYHQYYYAQQQYQMYYAQQAAAAAAAAATTAPSASGAEDSTSPPGSAYAGNTGAGPSPTGTPDASTHRRQASTTSSAGNGKPPQQWSGGGGAHGAPPPPQGFGFYPPSAPYHHPAYNTLPTGNSDGPGQSQQQPGSAPSPHQQRHQQQQQEGFHSGAYDTSTRQQHQQGDLPRPAHQRQESSSDRRNSGDWGDGDGRLLYEEDRYYNYYDATADPNGNWAEHVVVDDGSGYPRDQQQQQQPYSPNHRYAHHQQQQQQPFRYSPSLPQGHDGHNGDVATYYDPQGYQYRSSYADTEQYVNSQCENVTAEGGGGGGYEVGVDYGAKGEDVADGRLTAAAGGGSSSPANEGVGAAVEKAHRAAAPSNRQQRHQRQQQKQSKSSKQGKATASPTRGDADGLGRLTEREDEGSGSSREPGDASEHPDLSSGEFHSAVEAEASSSLEYTQNLVESSGGGGESNAPHFPASRHARRGSSGLLRPVGPVKDVPTGGFNSLLNGAMVGKAVQALDSPPLSTSASGMGERGQSTFPKLSAHGRREDEEERGGRDTTECTTPGRDSALREERRGPGSGRTARRSTTTTALPIDASLNEDEEEQEEAEGVAETDVTVHSGTSGEMPGVPGTDARHGLSSTEIATTAPAPSPRSTTTPQPSSSRPIFRHHHHHHHQLANPNRVGPYTSHTTPPSEAAAASPPYPGPYGSLSSSLPMGSLPPHMNHSATGSEGLYESPRDYPSPGSTSSLRQLRQSQQLYCSGDSPSLAFQGVGAAATMGNSPSSLASGQQRQSPQPQGSSRGGVHHASQALPPAAAIGEVGNVQSDSRAAGTSGAGQEGGRSGLRRGVGALSRRSVEVQQPVMRRSEDCNSNSVGGSDFPASPVAAGTAPTPPDSPASSLLARGGNNAAGKANGTPTTTAVGVMASPPPSTQAPVLPQHQQQQQQRPHHRSGKSNNNNNNNNNNGAVSSRGGGGGGSAPSPFLYEHHTGTEVWVEEAEQDFPFDPSTYGNFACLVNAVSPEVPVAYEMQIPCDETTCGLAPLPPAEEKPRKAHTTKAAKADKAAEQCTVGEASADVESAGRDEAVVGLPNEATEPILLAETQPGRASREDDTCRSCSSSSGYHATTTTGRSSSNSETLPTYASVRPYRDFSGPYFTEPIITLESVWQSFDVPFGCSVPLAHPAFLTKVRAAEDSVVYVPILSGFRVRFHDCSAAQGKLRALHLLRSQRAATATTTPGEQPTFSAFADGLLTWSATERPDNRNGVAEQIRELAQADEAYTTLLTATTADVDHQSWVAVMWQPVFCGGHSAKHSCGTFLAYYLLRAPHHLFLPYTDKSHGAAMNSSWSSPVFRADRMVIAFDIWEFQRRYELGRRVEGAWKQQQHQHHHQEHQHQQSHQSTGDDHGSFAGCVPAVVGGDGGLEGNEDSHPARPSSLLDAQTQSAGRAATASHITDGTAREDLLSNGVAAPLPIPPPYVRLPIVGFVPNRCRSDVWMLPSNIPLNGNISGGSGGKGGAVWPLRAPLFLLASAMQLMVWNATEEGNRLEALKKRKAEEEEATAVAAAAAAEAEAEPAGSPPSPPQTGEGTAPRVCLTLTGIDGIEEESESAIRTAEAGAATEHKSEASSSQTSTPSMLTRAATRALATNHQASEQTKEAGKASAATTGGAPALEMDALKDAMPGSAEEEDRPSHKAVSPSSLSSSSAAAAAPAQKEAAVATHEPPYFKRGVELLARAAEMYRALRESAMLDYAEDIATTVSAARISPSASPQAANAGLASGAGGAARRGNGAKEEATSPSSPSAPLQPQQQTPSPAPVRRLIVGGTNRELCGVAGDVIVGLLDFYQWAQYDTALIDFAERYCAE